MRSANRSKPHVEAGDHKMSDDRELHRAAKANRERLAVAHREVVLQEEAKMPLIFAKTWRASRN